MLVFQVDLFPARGERPHDMEEAWSREKDIRYSSRTRRISDGLVRRRKEHRLIDRMLQKLPAGVCRPVRGQGGAQDGRQQGAQRRAVGPPAARVADGRARFRIFAIDDGGQLGARPSKRSRPR
jgi:hypothetical protein